MAAQRMRLARGQERFNPLPKFIGDTPAIIHHLSFGTRGQNARLGHRMISFEKSVQLYTS